MFRVEKAIETESRLVVSRGCGVSSWGDKNILKLIVVIDAKL